MLNNSIPTYEKPIYESLVQIRTYLSAIKQDRSKFIDSKDIYKTYEQVLYLITDLKTIRKDEELKGMNLNLPNRIDSVLDDVFQLLSLSFMTVGLIKLAPATYASLSTVQRLLEHLNESEVYTFDDLRPIKSRLDEIRKIVLGGSTTIEEEETHSSLLNDHEKEEILLLRNKLNICENEYRKLESNIVKIPEDLKPILNELINIKKELLSLATSTSNFKDSDLNFKIEKLEKRINNISDKRDENGYFISDNKTVYENSQGVLNGLLDECNNFVNDLTVNKKNNAIDDSLKSVYDKLITIKSTLENLLVTRRWTLRETDLFNYQKQLQEIDELRTNGSFINSKGDKCKGQSILLYLLRRCYAMIYKLLESSEAVSEALQPLHNQLSTVRRCLLEVKRMGGISNTRELYPYQFKLASLDNLRVDGKFMVNNQIPEGQGTLNALLAECFDICHEMKIELEENDDDESDVEMEDKSANNNIQMTKNDLTNDNYDSYEDGNYHEGGRSGKLNASFNKLKIVNVEQGYAEHDATGENATGVLIDSEYENNDYY